MYKRIVFIVASVFILASAFYLSRHHNTAGVYTLPSAERVSPSVSPSEDGITGVHLDHLVLIVMENKSASDIVNNLQAPYLNSLIQKYSLSGNYSAVAHPSLPNYLALIGGSTFGITSDCTDCFIEAPNLIDQLQTAGKSWKAYMESMPSPCFVGNSGDYAQKHNPFIYFNDIRNDAAKCQNIVPYSSLLSDLSSVETTPDFVWITPDMCHDMHDCPVKTGDNWLSQQVPQILGSPSFATQSSLLVITWDEGDDLLSNLTPAIFIGNLVKSGYVSPNPYTHYSLLHTIESLWSLSPLTADVKSASLITDIWK